MTRVYLETSFFSECCTIRTGDIAKGRRATSLAWWNTQASKFDMCISNEVLQELSSPAFPTEVRDPALLMTQNLPLLELNNAVVGVAAYL